MGRPRKHKIRSRLTSGASTMSMLCPDHVAELVREAAQSYGPDDLPQRVWERFGLYLAHCDAHRKRVGLAEELLDLDDIESDARAVSALIESGSNDAGRVKLACRLGERLDHFPSRLFSETTTWSRDEAMAALHAITRLAANIPRVAHWPQLRVELELDLETLFGACQRVRKARLPTITKPTLSARDWFQRELESIYRDEVQPDRMSAWRDSHDANDPPPSPRHREFATEVMRALGVRFERKQRLP